MDNFEQNSFNDDNNSNKEDFSGVDGSDGTYVQNPGNGSDGAYVQNPGNGSDGAYVQNPGTGSDGAYVQNSGDADYAFEYARYIGKKRFNKTPLILALFGLIFSVFYGAGMILGIIALVIAARRYKISKSEPLKWAIIVSITCIALSVAFIAAIAGAALLAIMRQIPEETVSIISKI